jgi:hypothetical protein
MLNFGKIIIFSCIDRPKIEKNLHKDYFQKTILNFGMRLDRT